MISKFTIKSILIKFFETHIYLFQKKKLLLLEISCILFHGEDDLPNFSSSSTKLPEILNSLSLPVETIFRSAKLQSPRHLFYHRSPLGPRVWRVVDNLSSSFLFTHFSFLCFLSNFPPFSPENLSPRLFIVSLLFLCIFLYDKITNGIRSNIFYFFFLINHLQSSHQLHIYSHLFKSNGILIILLVRKLNTSVYNYIFIIR